MSLQIIKKTPTTQSQIIQRIGRVGRTMPGIAYHLYTENQFNNFGLYPEPNIKLILTKAQKDSPQMIKWDVKVA